MQRDRRASVRWLTATAWASLLVFALTSTLTSVSLKAIGSDLAIGYGTRGMLALARSVVLAASTFCVGYLADRTGKRRLLSAGMLVVAVGLLHVGRSEGFGGLVLGSMVTGLGLGALEALVSPLVADLHPRSVETQMNVLHGFFPLGVVASSPLVAAALDAGVAWRRPFLVAVLPAAAVAAMYAFGRYPGAAAEDRPEPLSVSRILHSRLFWGLAVAMMLTAGCEGALLYWSPNFIQDAYGASAKAGSAGLMAFTAAMAFGRFGTGAAARVVPLLRIMLAMIAITVVSTLALVLMKGRAATMGALILAGVGVACFWPSILTVATRRIAAGSATLLAMLSVAGIVGFGVVPAIIGRAADAVGLRAGLALVPASLVVAGVALVMVFRLDARAAGGGATD